MLGKDPEMVAYCEWLEVLTAAASNDKAASYVPATKLLAFFRVLGEARARRPVFSCEATQAESSRLRDVDPISLQWF